MTDYIDIVFDGPPGPSKQLSGHFVEVEDMHGFSILVGEWLQRPDGYWVLRLNPELEIAKRKRHMHIAGTTVGKHIDECAKCGEDIRSPIHSREA